MRRIFDDINRARFSLFHIDLQRYDPPEQGSKCCWIMQSKPFKKTHTALLGCCDQFSFASRFAIRVQYRHHLWKTQFLASRQQIVLQIWRDGIQGTSLTPTTTLAFLVRFESL